MITCPIYESGRRRRGGLGGEVAKGRVSRRKHLKGIFKRWNIKIFMLENLVRSRSDLHDITKQTTSGQQESSDTKLYKLSTYTFVSHKAINKLRENTYLMISLNFH